MQFVFAKFSDSTFCPQISFCTLFHVFLKGIFLFLEMQTHLQITNISMFYIFKGEKIVKTGLICS